MSKKQKASKSTDKKLKAEVKFLKKKVKDLKKKVDLLKSKNEDLKKKIAKNKKEAKKTAVVAKPKKDAKNKTVVNKPKKETKKTKADPAIKTSPIKPALVDNGQSTKPSDDSSTNYSVRDAISRLRSFTKTKDVLAFTKSETRVSIKRLLPGLLDKLG